MKRKTAILYGLAFLTLQQYAFRTLIMLRVKAPNALVLSIIFSLIIMFLYHFRERLAKPPNAIETERI